jgi:outer membrane protein TolC
VQLPLSLIAQNPHIKRAARARVSVAQNHVNLTKLSLRATVLKLYSEYKKTELVLLVRKQSSSDDESNYLLVEQKFKNGELMVDDYMRAQRGRNDLKIQLAIADNDFKKAKLDVEEIIGMRLEDVR